MIQCSLHFDTHLIFACILVLIETKTTKPYISAKIEAVKHLHVVFLRTAEQRLSVILSPTSNQIVENYVNFDVI